MESNSFDAHQGIKFFFTRPQQERTQEDQSESEAESSKPEKKLTKPNKKTSLKILHIVHSKDKLQDTNGKIRKLKYTSRKMSSRASSNKEEINSLSSLSILPPIANHNENVNDKQGFDISAVSDNRFLFVPSATPDSRYESGEFQKRIGSPECIQCQMEQESMQGVMLASTSNHHNHLNETPGKSSNLKSSKAKDIVYIPNALPEIVHEESESSLRKHTKGNKLDDIKIPQSSRLPSKFVRYKDKGMYKSWDGGLHSYPIEEEDSDSDEEPLIFRFRLKDHQKKKRIKTPPKYPFRQTILSDIENRRSQRLKASKDFSSSENLLQGLQVYEDKSPSNDLDFRNLHPRSQDIPHGHRLHQSPIRQDYVSSMEKGSQLFVKHGQRDKVKRPFLPSTDDKPHVLRGRTVLRNPLAPVSLQDRYKPVVVLKSKLDDYTDAIRDFLEYIIDEQKRSVGDRQPIPFDQSDENMVIYKDIDDIAHMKEMAKAMRFGLATLSNSTKSNPQGQLIKGTTRIKKIGALDPSLNSYRYRSPHKMSVGGQSVFITEPNPTDVENASKQNSRADHYNSNSRAYNHKSHSRVGSTDPKDNAKYVIYSNNSKTTSAPPNTPHAATLQAVGSESEF